MQFLVNRLYAELRKRGIPCVSLNSNLGSQDLDWGSDAFKKRVRQSRQEAVLLKCCFQTDSLIRKVH